MHVIAKFQGYIFLLNYPVFQPISFNTGFLPGNENINMEQQVPLPKPSDFNTEKPNVLSGIKVVAHLLSVLLHPVLIPTYLAMFIVWVLPNIFGFYTSGQAVFVVRTIALYTLLFPLMIVFLMRRLDFIDSFQVTDRKQRILVFMPMAFLYTWTCTVLYREQLPVIAAKMMFGATIALFLSMIVNIMVEKISIHAIGMGGAFAVVLFVSGISIFNIAWALMLVIFLTGAVGTSRLILNAHQPREVYNGYMLGFLCMSVSLLLF